MATVEELQTSLDALRAEFEEFKSYAMPVISGHQGGIAPVAGKFDNPPTQQPEPK
jgi:hypothetical protein